MLEPIAYLVLMVDLWRQFDSNLILRTIRQRLDDCINCKFVYLENFQIALFLNNVISLLLRQNHHCQLTFIEGCKECIYGIFDADFPKNEMNIDGICYSICGDGNKIWFDGCFNCKFSSYQNCVIFLRELVMNVNNSIN
ncbi:unnamed protein product [Paramecium primaurelia]|uniref:Uncharacterized protein n=1 Tax=Paramecium primaurelia TaxID=5886 RepID=A0A8S1P3Q2_PARPR|nr:unnamed protein product [Paramecium primaurelia]